MIFESCAQVGGQKSEDRPERWFTDVCAGVEGRAAFAGLKLTLTAPSDVDYYPPKRLHYGWTRRAVLRQEAPGFALPGDEWRDP